MENARYIEINLMKNIISFFSVLSCTKHINDSDNDKKIILQERKYITYSYITLIFCNLSLSEVQMRHLSV